MSFERSTRKALNTYNYIFFDSAIGLEERTGLLDQYI